MGAPDIIIATPFPMLTMFIKLALLETNMTSKIISWLHAPIKAYDDNAAGGPECLNYANLVLVLSRSNYHIIHSFNPDINIRLVKIRLILIPYISILITIQKQEFILYRKTISGKEYIINY